MEGQGEWARARQYDKKALAMWEHTEVHGRSWGTVVNARRREGVQLIREVNHAAARRKLAFVERYYADAIEQAGINFNHLINLSAAMATLKVWAEACLLAAPADDDVIAHVNIALADVAEMEVILAAYWEGLLEETRREVREQWAEAAAAAASGAVMAEGDEDAVVSSGKSKAVKRKQQKRKAQQQRKRAAEVAAAAAERAGGDGAQAAMSGQERRTVVEEGQQTTEQEQQLQQDPGGLVAATLGLTLQEEEGAGEEEEEKGEEEEDDEEECPVCLCVLLESEDRGCRTRVSACVPHDVPDSLASELSQEVGPSSRPVLIAGRPCSLKGKVVNAEDGGWGESLGTGYGNSS